MSFRLVESGWDEVLDYALRSDNSSLRIICPFIKRRAAERLLRRGSPKQFQVITRFSLQDFAEGVSDISALRFLLENGAQIRGVRNLHAKLYLFGESRVILTSANLTEAALLRNHEFGFVAQDLGIVDQCRQYFDGLWVRSGQTLPVARLAEWEGELARHLVIGAPPSQMTRLGDQGVEAGYLPEPILPSAWTGEVGQSFVKFFGSSQNRAARSMEVFTEVTNSGCHWACTYPYGKRPRQVRDGAVMFMGRLVKDPDDILIYGRAIGVPHEPGRDDATAEDIRLRDWKEKYPHYIRVHHAEFIGGKLANGVSLNEMMAALASNAFVSTQEHAGRGAGNTNPRSAYMRQAAVELAPHGFRWIQEKLEQAYTRHGKLAPALLEGLDWPATLSDAAAGKQ